MLTAFSAHKQEVQSSHQLAPAKDMKHALPYKPDTATMATNMIQSVNPKLPLLDVCALSRKKDGAR
eukprot:1829380-Amphidinium_carterae.3